ncbi:MAG: single-stranded-DNA-specific exonuclease RecJ [Anaerolineae bacterium]|jgi:single-stranded-DNA-specific exonuclease|nr:single-stranded-DNA-specific exonuclease RecJ [Anaerolineae bacterium]
MQAVKHKHWAIAPVLPEDIQQELSGYHRLLQQLLYNRGIVTKEGADRYVRQSGPLYDPFLLKDMETAVERLRQALQQRERIIVYGDYDCDGVTATAMLVEFLQRVGANAEGYIPDRFDEGYGLNKDAILQLAAEGCQLLVTVDCGIRSVEEVALAVERGMDVILSDHHLPGEVLPPALAIIDHRQPGDEYPEKELCGAGLAFKMIEAYLQRVPTEGVEAAEWLDLAAVATVADIVPLTGENRALVKAGLEVIRQGKRVGLNALIGAAGLQSGTFKASNIAFGIGPRINAAGRIENAQVALQLLTSHDPHEAATLAQGLDDLNTRRQEETVDVQRVAEEQALESGDPPLIFATSPDFHMGVVGLAASRLTETYYRPAVVVALGEDYARASCRSIPEFHITHALDGCQDLFDVNDGERYGGHAAAAGFTIRNEKLPELRRRLLDAARSQIDSKPLVPTIPVDVSFNFGYLLRNRENIYKLVQLLEPTGTANDPVLFAARDLRVVNAYAVGRDQTHLRLKLSDGFSSEYVIAFRQAYWLENMPERVDILFTLDRNLYNGKVDFQVLVREIRPHQPEITPSQDSVL